MLAQNKANVDIAKNLTYEDLEKHFDIPLAEVAELYKVSITLMKHICRKAGISRWPRRANIKRRRLEAMTRTREQRESEL